MINGRCLVAFEVQKLTRPSSASPDSPCAGAYSNARRGG